MTTDVTSKYETIHLKDYKPASFAIDQIELTFELDPERTIVSNTMTFKRNISFASPDTPLVLQGNNLELLAVYLDQQPLSDNRFTCDDHQLTIFDVPADFTLTIKTAIQPKANTALSGLYQSNDLLCTQCEAHGFQRITYFLDRPDVMASYKTTLIADKNLYPTLLSNGNCVASGVSDDNKSGDNKHWVTWEDPFKKPCYLFAVVAGDLEYIEESFMTKSGRDVVLRIYVEHGNANKCQHAMHSLKQAMKWDEDVYGREYDLDIFMIVAVSDFTAGAMENKGLNIFNAKYILANADMATDDDYEHIQAVVAHEYFHNWTGNRITCRDWFQLSLKEGLTVFREQEFIRDMNSTDVNRIKDVQILWNHQFIEDAGPMAHPVQPDSYVEVNNFYTATIYNKGAEVIRMMHRLLGKEGFRLGMDLYFERHDGQAVTINDFVTAMEEANSVELKQFRRWYHQAGTPQLHMETHYHSDEQYYELRLKQTCLPTPGQATKEPFHMPVSVALLDGHGKSMSLQLAGESAPGVTSKLLNITQQQQIFRFINVAEKPVPSVLRDYSAPVKLSHDLSHDDLITLLAHDSNGFSRWHAGQMLAQDILLSLIQCVQQQHALSIDDDILQAYQAVLQDTTLDCALKARILMLPDENYLAELLPTIDAQAVHQARQFMRQQIAQHLSSVFISTYQQYANDTYRNDAKAIAERSLKNICLSYLMTLVEQPFIDLAFKQFNQADNMTDRLHALGELAHLDVAERQMALDAFYQCWSADALVLDKWFATQARSSLPTTLENVRRLLKHEAFSITNPNKVRALLGSFAVGNPACFHGDAQASYPFYTQQIIKLDGINAQVAASLVKPFMQWKRWQEPQRSLQKQQLEIILSQDHLSTDVHEVVSKSLQE